MGKRRGVPAGRFLASSLAVVLAVTMVLLTPGEGRALSRGQKAFVSVAVATLWTGPGQNRPLDRPAVSNPVDINRWTRSMTLPEKNWLIGRLQTQALLGQRVTVLAERGAWVKIAVEGQPTPKSRLGYPGWVPRRQLSASVPRYARLYRSRGFAQVDRRLALLYQDRAARTVQHSVSYGTRLPVVRALPGRVRVAVPGTRDRWLRRGDVRLYSGHAAIPDPSPSALVGTARKFLGLRYLWAGTSGYGFDCSGFTHLIYRSHGITIPRDAQDQARAGRFVALFRLRPGDLLFFAHNGGAGDVHHVGMYIGRGRMIHSPNHSTAVRVDHVRSSGWMEKYAGARRYT